MNESTVIEIPKALIDGDYVTWDFGCPHCKSPFTHHKNDLAIKTCISCNNLYSCDDIGQTLKIGEINNFVYNGKEFVTMKNKKAMKIKEDKPYLKKYKTSKKMNGKYQKNRTF